MTARDDQTATALREAGELHRAVAAAGDGHAGLRDDRWARALVDDRRRRFEVADPTLLACPHVAAPSAVLVASWAPTYTCPMCLEYVPVPELGHADRCDCCSKPTGQLVEVMLLRAPAVVLGLVCDDCWVPMAMVVWHPEQLPWPPVVDMHAPGRHTAPTAVRGLRWRVVS